MSDKKNTENLTIETAETVASELLARDEQVVGMFFSAVATQYFLHKDMLSTKIISPNFISLFGDIETFATQRMFIKDLIHNKKFSKVIEELQTIFLEYCSNPRKNPQPYILFLSRINKSLLIRQVFNHSNQVAEKYSFMEDFLGQQKIDLDKLNAKMWHFPVDQQILILARIYDKINDEYLDKKKTIGTSYKENVVRFVAEVNKFPNKYQVMQVNNIRAFMQELENKKQ